MGEPARKYWFPAKRYGWGWGPPVTWQGWTVLIVWTAAFTAGVSLLLPTRRPVLYGVFVAAMIGIILAVCYAKGEPPRWRWGGDKDDGSR
jgi:hypothetical protein